MRNTNGDKVKYGTNEIDLSDLLNAVWKGRTLLIKIIIVFTVIGLNVALFSPKEYIATTTLIPHDEESYASLDISGFESFSGINFSQRMSEITPPIYNQIIKSKPFHLKLMQTKLNFSHFDEAISLYEYFIKHHKNTFRQSIKKYVLGLMDMDEQSRCQTSADTLLSPFNPTRLTQNQKFISELLIDRISVEHKSKYGYIAVSCRMPEALAAAQLTRSCSEVLQSIIIDYKLETAKHSLEFIQQRYNESEKNYNEFQKKLALFRDQNNNIIGTSALVESDRLNDACKLAFISYSQLAILLEKSKIEVKESTPVFTVIEPSVVPVERFKPKRALIMVNWIFFGAITGFWIAFGKEYYKTIFLK
ncbi:MAG TPA: Wzz/FepE/Etk N-terminal domain-containing protein [Bacteroidales bacterium]|nr:Wzz/FepE/Etk N-terminal domain-containing protein [Bacteroidales bacterium]